MQPLESLKAKLQNLLLDSAEKLESQLDELIASALRDFSRYKPLTKSGFITLQADVCEYAAPDDLLDIKVHQWGQQQRRLPMWDPQYPRRLPRAQIIGEEPALIQLSFAPSGALISNLGARFPFTYSAYRTIEGDSVPIREHDIDILLLRAVAEAMRVLANTNVNRPVTTRSAVGSAPKNGTPAALCELYMHQFEAMVKRA